MKTNLWLHFDNPQHLLDKCSELGFFEGYDKSNPKKFAGQVNWAVNQTCQISIPRHCSVGDGVNTFSIIHPESHTHDVGSFVPIILGEGGTSLKVLSKTWCGEKLEDVVLEVSFNNSLGKDEAPQSQINQEVAEKCGEFRGRTILEFWGDKTLFSTVGGDDPDGKVDLSKADEKTGQGFYDLNRKSVLTLLRAMSKIDVEDDIRNEFHEKVLELVKFE